MARIRTIKPEFFTSEDIVSLSPMARLLYIAVWCEADREGRLEWKPQTFKYRYFPADECDIQALCSELTGRGLVKLYNNGLAYVPRFNAHQHINPREAASNLPTPDASGTRGARVSDAQGGREGKGKEGKEKDASRDASTLTQWIDNLNGAEAIPASDPIFEWAGKQGIPGDWLAYAWAEFESRYADGGTKAAKTYIDWRATFRDHVRRDWLGIWRHDVRTGAYVLTTAGVQWQKELSA